MNLILNRLRMDIFNIIVKQITLNLITVNIIILTIIVTENVFGG